ncbi:MAG: NAD(P)/FAD-dependent oxidoreductase [Spirochaetales bacterium]|nr:NAD(P)/FAD-dependent oxidoreductase [Spirochaetales bacterium]
MAKPRHVDKTRGSGAETGALPLAKALDKLRKAYGTGIELRDDRGSLALEGAVATWRDKIDAGWAAARFGYRGVVNDLAVPGLEPERLEPPGIKDCSLDGLAVDVAVIGGGVIGASVARELARWNLSIILIEKEYDVAVHTSGRNDGMIHDGFAAKPGTKKAWYNVRGNRLWGSWARELGVDFKRQGSLVLFRGRTSAAAYPLMASRAKENGVDGWEYWSRSRVRAEEPNASPGQHGGFFLPSAGSLSPYKATVAIAENAAANGVRVSFDTCVLGFDLESESIAAVRTNRGTFRARAVVNAAGNWADAVAGMAGDRFFSLHQRRGSDLILDVTTGVTQKHIMSMPSLFQAREKTKGGGLVLTPEGNILVGPTARELPGREDYATAPEEIRELERHLKVNVRLSLSHVITYFAGVRPCTYEEDFIVEPSQRVRNLVHAAGIQSPGLASAPAIAEDVSAMVVRVLERSMAVRPRADWKPHRLAPPELRRLPLEERARLIAANPRYGRIVCRCEEISEGEVRNALRSTLPVSSLDAVKRRTRAGMGRCHGGFCTPRVMEIVASETGTGLCDVLKKGEGSWMCAGPSKSGGRS